MYPMALARNSFISTVPNRRATSPANEPVLRGRVVRVFEKVC